MKKFTKIFAVMTVAVMMLGSALTVCAAPSSTTVSAKAADVAAVSAKTASGAEVKVAPVAEAKIAEAKTAITTVLASSVSGGTLQVEKCFELTATISGPTDITIDVPGITAGQKVYILHQKADGAWENIPVTKVEAGKVTGTFTSLSPVAIITTTAPKTAETFPVAGVVCVFALLGAAVCVKKFAL